MDNITHQDLLNKVSGIIVLMTDFGLKDGTVNELKGVIYAVDKSLIISDLTHEIKAFDIFEAAYRLYQVAPFWPTGTVFVSVVDPWGWN
jgi:S-adenosylmethionine hydrolase